MILEAEAYLEHYGKKGMKWGERKAAFQTNRKLNKESRAKQKVKDAKNFEKYRASLRPSTTPVKTNSAKSARDARRADIDRARERVNSGALRADGKQAKTQYKKDKAKIGTHAARKILRQKRAELWKDQERANETRDGAELVVNILRTMQENSRARMRTNTNPNRPF